MGDRRLEAVLYWTLGSSNLCCLPRISQGLGDELEAQMMSISDLLGSKPALVNQLGHNLRLSCLLLKILDSEILVTLKTLHRNGTDAQEQWRVHI